MTRPTGEDEMSSEHVEVLRELRDTGDVSDWRAMESALDAAIAALSATQPPAEAQPGDWVLVPRGPTQAMLDAGHWPCVQGRGAKSVWATMLAATPLSREYGSVQEMFNPSAPVGVERILAEMREEGQADIVDGGVVLEWEDDLRNALSQQPAAVGVEGLVETWEKRAGELNDEGLYGCCAETYEQCAAQVRALAQQPAPVAPVGVEEIREDDIAKIAWQAGFHLEKEDAEGEPTDDWQWPNSEGENMFPDLVKFSRKIAALAQQPAPTLPDVDDDDLTVAYMAGRHDGRKEAQQPAAVDEAMVERIAALLHEEATDEPWAVAGVEHDGPDRDYYRTLAHKVIVRAAQQGDES